MNFYIDTEFIEGPQPLTFLRVNYGQSKPVIDLISIGIVDEYGREFYKISNEFNLSHSWDDDWIRKNVLLPILLDKEPEWAFTKSSMKRLVKKHGFSKKVISNQILIFIRDQGGDIWRSGAYENSEKYLFALRTEPMYKKPVFWAYYASTDWVAFYQLFGKMIELPPIFPMYIKDLKQLMDSRGLTKEWKRENCPEPENAHNALADAKWNRVLHRKIAIEARK